jgi:hypothetical protein
LENNGWNSLLYLSDFFKNPLINYALGLSPYNRHLHPCFKSCDQSFIDNFSFMANNSEHHHLDKVTAAGLMVAMGIVYGDIGTSPLYVMQAIIGKSVINEAGSFGSAILRVLDA